MIKEEPNKLYFVSKNFPAIDRDEIISCFEDVRSKILNDFEDILNFPEPSAKREAAILLLMYKRVMDSSINLNPEEKKLHNFFEAIDPFIPDISDTVFNWGDGIIISSRVNQMMAQNMYEVVKTPTNSPDRSLFDLFNFLITHTYEQRSALGNIIKLAILSASAQVAATNLLSELNYKVFSPNIYNKDEVANWDTHGGVDIAAVSASRKLILLVDVKAYSTSMNLNVGLRSDKERYLKYRLNIIEDVKSRLDYSISGFNTIHVLVGVPTDGIGVTLLGEIKSPIFKDQLDKGITRVIESPDKTNTRNIDIAMRDKKSESIVSKFTRIFKS